MSEDQFIQQNLTQNTMTFRSGCLILWSRSKSNGTRQLTETDLIMNSEEYINLLIARIRRYNRKKNMIDSMTFYKNVFRW